MFQSKEIPKQLINQLSILEFHSSLRSEFCKITKLCRFEAIDLEKHVSAYPICLILLQVFSKQIADSKFS